MPLATGVRFGSYEVIALLGAGGMGEVYRARDTKLNREVALKVLPDQFSLDADRLARFKREAELLASLNHPNIAAIYGREDAEGTQALVLELVDGPTLADRIAEGPIPPNEALPIARQTADALDAAHEHGVIHRDLKPGNIKVRPDGTVKVLDFGLAKLTDPNVSNVPNVPNALSMSPTITNVSMMTGIGLLLGTAAYMAPEQAKGRAVDKRADIWAFGCVLYEMLTGKRTFAGEDVSDTLAFILTKEPDWNAIPANTPESIRKLLRRCVDKDRKRRLADIADARFEIDEALAAPAGTTQAAATTPRVVRWRRPAVLAPFALVAGAAIASVAVWFALRPVAPRVSRLVIAPSSTAELSINGVEQALAITPDGSRVIYVGNNNQQLFVRALDALEPTAIFKGAPRAPFVSPDGQWIGFVDNTNVLKRVAVTGGPPVTVASLDGGSRGATWGPNDTMIFATNNATTGLQRVAAGGGPVTVLTRPDHAQGEADHFWPEMLPGGRVVLFTITAQTGGLDAAQVAALDLQSETRKILVRGGSHAHYVPSGHLVYAAGGTFRAVAFDPGSLETRGTPVPVIPDVSMTGDGAVDATIARDSTLAYASGGATAVTQRTLVWVDRTGRETIAAPPSAFVYPRLSPDGQRVAVYTGDRERDIWIWDLIRLTLTRATFDPALDGHPAWTPDGRRLIFSSERAGARNLFWEAADGTGAVERLTESPNLQDAASVSPDGTRLIF
jgi:hypothetical protein